MTFNSNSPTMRRILKEAQELSSNPSSEFSAHPLESDLFEWHFTLRGPPNSPFSGGIYHGRINLPPTYPLRPPSFRFLTPSGRFEVNREICLSISGHHEETWQPAWGLRTALMALRSFMETDPKGQLGGLDTPEGVRRKLAGESLGWSCGSCGRTNGEIMKKCDEVVVAAGKEKEVTEVPNDMKLGWKDEMGKNKSGCEDTESAKLAEGFVQTDADQCAEVVTAHVNVTTSAAAVAPVPPQVHAQAQTPGSGRGAVTVDGVARQRLLVAQPGGSAGHETARQQQLNHVHSTNDGAPVWLDQLIVLVAVVLAGMVFKVFAF